MKTNGTNFEQHHQAGKHNNSEEFLETPVTTSKFP